MDCKDESLAKKATEAVRGFITDASLDPDQILSDWSNSSSSKDKGELNRINLFSLDLLEK